MNPVIASSALTVETSPLRRRAAPGLPGMPPGQPLAACLEGDLTRNVSAPINLAQAQALSAAPGGAYPASQPSDSPGGRLGQVNHLNLAAQLAQLDFGRTDSPQQPRGHGGLFSPLHPALSPSPSMADSPMLRAVLPYEQTPSSSPPLKRPQPLGRIRSDTSDVTSLCDSAAAQLRPARAHLRPPDGATGLMRARSHGGDYGGRGDARDVGGCPIADVVIDICPAINPYLAHYAAPAPRDGSPVRCTVLRMRGKRRLVSYRMLTESGDELLTAVRRQDDFWISMTSSELAQPGGGNGVPNWSKAQRSAFSVLRCPPDLGSQAEPQHREFFAYNASYDGRELLPLGEPILAVSHSTLAASADLPQVNTMCACFPGPDSDAPPCTRSGLRHALQAAFDSSPGGKARDPAHARAGQGARVPEGMCALTSRLPVWNARNASYVLNFFGRATLASSKNVQLVDGADDGADGRSKGAAKDLPTLLFGKVDKDTFNLDFKYPLSAYHAFVIALSVSDW